MSMNPLLESNRQTVVLKEVEETSMVIVVGAVKLNVQRSAGWSKLHTPFASVRESRPAKLLESVIGFPNGSPDCNDTV